MSKLIPKSELHHQPGQVLDTYQAVEEFKQALNYPGDLSDGGSLAGEFIGENLYRATP